MSSEPQDLSPRILSNRQLDVRSGSSVNYPGLARQPANRTVNIVGRSNQANWYQIRLPNGVVGWVEVQAGEAQGDLESLTMVTSPDLAKIYNRADKIAIVIVGLYTWLFMIICIVAILQLHFERFSAESASVAVAERAETETPNDEPAGENTAAPPPSTQAQAEEAPRTMTLLLWRLPITSDTRLLWLVLFAGALGALVHSMRWYSNYMARHAFSADWLATYLLRPFASAALAALIYAALRSGLLTATATIEDTNTFGFVVIAGFTGLFFDQAIFRLRRVSETIFDPNQNAGVDASGTNNV